MVFIFFHIIMLFRSIRMQLTWILKRTKMLSFSTKCWAFSSHFYKFCTSTGSTCCPRQFGKLLEADLKPFMTHKKGLVSGNRRKRSEKNCKTKKIFGRAIFYLNFRKFSIRYEKFRRLPSLIRIEIRSLLFCWINDL